MQTSLALVALLIGMVSWALWQPKQPVARDESASDAPDDDDAPLASEVPPPATLPANSLPPRARPLGQALNAPPPRLVASTGPRDVRGELKFGPFKHAGQPVMTDRFRAELAQRGLRWQIAAQKSPDTQARSEPKAWAELMQSWSAESHDPAWSSQVMTQLEQTASFARLDPQAIKQADCRASLCRVQLEFPKPELAARFQAAVDPDGRSRMQSVDGDPSRFELMVDRSFDDGDVAKPPPAPAPPPPALAPN